MKYALWLAGIVIAALVVWYLWISKGHHLVNLRSHLSTRETLIDLGPISIKHRVIFVWFYYCLRLDRLVCGGPPQLKSF